MNVDREYTSFFEHLKLEDPSFLLKSNTPNNPSEPSEQPAPSQSRCVPSPRITHGSGVSATSEQPPLPSNVIQRPVRPRITEEMGAKHILAVVRIMRINGGLHYYDRHVGYYRPCSRSSLRELIMEHLEPIVTQKGSLTYVKHVEEFIACHPSLRSNHEADLNLVAFPNGTLDLTTWSFSTRFLPEKLITAPLCATYCAGSLKQHPVFDRFLDDICGHDQLLRKRIWQAIGYLLVPDPGARAIILLQGVSGSGKSVLCDFIRGCFPDDAVAAMDITELSSRSVLGTLHGKRLLLSAELPDAILSSKVLTTLKRLSGNDLLQAESRGTAVTFKNTAKIILATNHPLLFTVHDSALTKRIITIPFAFPPQKFDRMLGKKIAAERDAIVGTALDYYKELVENNYNFAGDFLLNDVVAPLPSTEKSVADFLNRYCLLDRTAWTSTRALHSRFCEEYGVLCSKADFSQLFLAQCRASEYAVQKKRGRENGKGNSLYGFKGISLCPF